MPPYQEGNFQGYIRSTACNCHNVEEIRKLIATARQGLGTDLLAPWEDVVEFCERACLVPNLRMACKQALRETIDFCIENQFCHDDARFGKAVVTYMKFEQDRHLVLLNVFRKGYQGVDTMGDIWIEYAKMHIHDRSVDAAIGVLTYGLRKHIQTADHKKVEEFLRCMNDERVYPVVVSELKHAEVEDQKSRDDSANNSSRLWEFARRITANGKSRKPGKGGISNIILSAAIALIILCAIFPITSAKSDVMPDDDFDSSNKKVKFEDFDTNVTPIPASGGAVGAGGTHESHKDNETRAVAAVTSLGFIHAFIASFSVIVVSELGDKTFFIAAIMAMRHSRITVFSGAIAALGLMTVLSALFGYATTMIPKAITYYVSTALFLIFGAKMIYDGWRMSDDEGAEELEEVQATLRRRDDDNNDIESQTKDAQEVNQGYRLPSPIRRILFTLFSRVFLQAFTMTFLAEWGDRSQIATIILAAREDVPGVCIGGVLGHSCCTGLAVVGGKMIAQKISVRTVTIIGGVVFLVFAITSLFFDPDSV